MNNSVTVNGKIHPIEVDGEMPLLWFLRDTLDLTGTKYGCGKGLCGSCVVHIDGKAVRSCLTPVSRASGKSVTTIEGLSEDASHPLQKAWLSNNVPQCGYCQAGQIMKAADLLSRNPSPDEEEIIAAMKGHICRCGTYVRIKKAILTAADEMRGA